jgi:ribose transport system ATP-binding protein
LPALRALVALSLLWGIALVLDPRTLAPESIISMAPFIGVLGVAAIGQHLVIQQRGFDLSVSGNVSLAAVMVTALPPQDAGTASTLAFVVMALFFGVLAGFVNGVAINWLRIPPLVTTIGTNAMLVGAVFYLTHAAVHAAPQSLTTLATGRAGAVSVLFLAFLALAVVAAWVIDRTSIGRGFIASAISPAASRVLGIKVARYNVLTYCIAGLLFSLAGVMLAGLAVTPTLLSGSPYMLTTVAAVIVGGSPLNGERGSVAATMIGVIFLVFLDQLVVSLGFTYAVQSIVQAAIILAGVAVPEVMRYIRGTRSLRTSESPAKSAVRTNAVATNPEALRESVTVLELLGVRKTFGNTVALSGVDFNVRAGEVHAIIGENGAGKSTLISVAAGVLEATEGKVKVAGQSMDVADPNRYRAAGVAVAFQHPPLPPHLTVLECLSLASPDFARDDGARRTIDLIARIALGPLRVSPRDRIADLSIGQCHVVEIARALASAPKILILDEPTEPFKEDDVAQLFTLIRSLKAEGVAVVYISHRLNEVEEIADRISVLRDGELIETRDRADFTHAEIISMIVGRPLGNVFPPKLSDQSAVPLLKVRNLSGRGFHNVSFDVKRGEIVGIAGVEGQGQRDLMRALAGLEKASGLVELKGQALSYSDRCSARAARVAFVPDDRHREGLFLSLSVKDNLGAGVVNRDGPQLLIDRKLEGQVVAASIRELRIKTERSTVPVLSLSGGNQQKVLIGREIAARPAILLADEPTKGVDIGSKSDIYQKLRQLANHGVAVVVSSSDGVELEGLCDHVIVMARGSVSCELQGEHVSDAEITAANLTASHVSIHDHKEQAQKSWRRQLLESRWLPVMVLLFATFAIGTAAVSTNGRFLSAYNLGNLQVQLATLALIGFGQLFLMLLGEIDFSVGPLAGLVVVLASYWIPEQATTMHVVFAMCSIVLLTATIGLIQGIFVIALNLPSIVVTLATFFALQGLSLLLRPVPGGTISATMIDGVLASVGPVSVVSILVLVASLYFERVLLRTHFGRSLRASGSHRFAAHKLGVKRAVVTPLAFAINGALVGVAGLVLAATAGVGSGTAGINYTLMSITAVVLGGAVISGGYGSFVATWCGAILVQVTFSATTFMQIGVEWQYWLVGVTTLLAAGLFGAGRRVAP